MEHDLHDNEISFNFVNMRLPLGKEGQGMRYAVELTRREGNKRCGVLIGGGCVIAQGNGVLPAKPTNDMGAEEWDKRIGGSVSARETDLARILTYNYISFAKDG